MTDSILDGIRNAIRSELSDADVEVSGGGGHYTIAVKSKAFAGKNMMESHRLVYSAIAPLMKGDSAPVHAVDSLKTTAR
ncbi:MAG: BolA/IbaG family iron-sulfur metabolism protein [Polyangiaceae bacterium]|jgi:acid stress-induced BolA-like protein IbaG/YrbA